MKHWIKRAIYFGAIMVLASVTFIALKTNPDPISRTEIQKLVQQLNEAAAIGVPHDFLMQEEKRSENQGILNKVESGQELSEGESKQYRQLFQSVLQDSQSFLARFDGQLTILHDYAMTASNNILGQGIAGLHDHHDVSARENFKLMLASLDALQTSSNSFGRIRYANAVQKDLVDLISHIGVAAHTVYVPYGPPETAWPHIKLGEAFEKYVEATKGAQFSPVNSTAYWRAIDESLSAYVDLIAMVQDLVNANTTPWERRIAGRFMSMQTLAPPVDLNRKLRRR